jgi:hypothetical protein
VPALPIEAIMFRSNPATSAIVSGILPGYVSATDLHLPVGSAAVGGKQSSDQGQFRSQLCKLLLECERIEWSWRIFISTARPVYPASLSGCVIRTAGTRCSRIVLGSRKRSVWVSCSRIRRSLSSWIRNVGKGKGPTTSGLGLATVGVISLNGGH